jgi:vacuolar-type H+-ATPase subunit I/STV1
MSPYWWGVDPAWKWAANGLQYTNSLKMKMSVVLGVSQMLFGNSSCPSHANHSFSDSQVQTHLVLKTALRNVSRAKQLPWPLAGITLKASNDIFFKEPLDFWCEFVPQIIFMSGIFGESFFVNN